MRSKRTTAGLSLLEVPDVIFMAKKNRLRAVFFVNGKFNVYPTEGPIFRRVVIDSPHNLVGVYDLRVVMAEQRVA